MAIYIFEYIPRIVRVIADQNIAVCSDPDAKRSVLKVPAFCGFTVAKVLSVKPSAIPAAVSVNESALAGPAQE